jgi:hypothetical protein
MDEYLMLNGNSFSTRSKKIAETSALKKNGNAPAAQNKRQPKKKTFTAMKIQTKGFKFDREEAYQ